MTNQKKIKVGLVDDHKLMRKGIADLITSFHKFIIILEADNGKDLQKKLHQLPKKDLPDLILMDIDMKEMNGYETTKWLKNQIPDTPKTLYKYRAEYKDIKVAALSADGKEFSIIQMLKCGATGYLFKDAEPEELKAALDDMYTKGYYYSQDANKIILQNLNTLKYHPNNQEVTFLQWVCTQLTYKEIADKMCLSKRRIDGIREALFDKLNVKNRVGLVIYAIERGIYKIPKSE